jgi:hypothetical protein
MHQSGFLPLGFGANPFAGQNVGREDNAAGIFRRILQARQTIAAIDQFLHGYFEIA